jgi:hypothetical protein
MQQFEEGLAAADQFLGFSVENELGPALGPQIALAINNVVFNMMAPQATQVDATIAIQLRDPQAAKRLLSILESKLEQQMAAMMQAMMPPGGAAPQTPKLFKGENYKGAELRYASLPMMPTMSPGYAIDEDFVLINTTVGYLKAAIDTRRGGAAASAAGHPALQALAAEFGHAEANKAGLVNLTALVGVFKQTVLPMAQMTVAADPEAARGLDLAVRILESIQTVAGSTRFTGESLHSVAAITLATPAP